MNREKQVVLVTGSSGLIGSAFIEQAAERFRIVGFDREGSPHPPAKAECVCVDLTSDESVAAGFARTRYGYGERIARWPARPGGPSTLSGSLGAWRTAAAPDRDDVLDLRRRETETAPLAHEGQHFDGVVSVAR
jgi:NAD(P)-dependent dehydrogenase (short-subunit alcohol dehydrogenase family)